MIEQQDAAGFLLGLVTAYWEQCDGPPMVYEHQAVEFGQSVEAIAKRIEADDQVDRTAVHGQMMMLLTLSTKGLHDGNDPTGLLDREFANLTHQDLQRLLMVLLGATAAQIGLLSRLSGYPVSKILQFMALAGQ